MIYHRDIREKDATPFKKCAVCRSSLRGSARGRGGSPYGTVSGALGRTRTGSTGSSVGAGVAAGGDPGGVPLHRFTQHTTAVKALAWDPHVPGVLATGGGKATVRLLVSAVNRDGRRRPWRTRGVAVSRQRIKPSF